VIKRSTTLESDLSDNGVAKGGDAGMEQRTVLVVDDEAVIRTLIAELLDEAGYSVLEADCGWQALQLAEEHLPTVVLVDQRLPDMSGLDVLERLRTRPASRHIPVIVVSGAAHQFADGNHGADRILTKPFDITDLVDQVNAVACDVRDGVA
jgi:CheY-like chemotaxis protein